MLNKEDLLKLAELHAGDFGINSDLIKAICFTESGLVTWAARFEPAWQYYTNVEEYSKLLNISYGTEMKLQSMSFGLMQVMGSVAREHGHRGMITELCDPDVGLLYGCKHLKKFLEKYGNLPDAVSAYNQGDNRKTNTREFKNQAYVNKIFEAMSAKVWEQKISSP